MVWFTSWDVLVKILSIYIYSCTRGFFILVDLQGQNQGDPQWLSLHWRTRKTSSCSAPEDRSHRIREIKDVVTSPLSEAWRLAEKLLKWICVRRVWCLQQQRCPHPSRMELPESTPRFVLSFFHSIWGTGLMVDALSSRMDLPSLADLIQIVPQTHPELSLLIS